MNYAIVTSSRTGNTAFLAQKLAEALPAQDCVFAGAPGQTLPDADLYELGEWGLRRAGYDDLDLVRTWRSFLEAPERFLRHPG